MAPLNFGERRKLEEFMGMGSGYVLSFSDRTFREFVHDSTGLDIDDPEVGGPGSKARRPGAPLLTLFEKWPASVTAG